MEECLREGPLLVHCSMGQSRSPTAILAYLLKVTYASPETPFDMRKKLLPTLIKFVQKRRPYTDPNIGFLRQLRSYEDNLKSQKNGS